MSTGSSGGKPPKPAITTEEEPGANRTLLEKLGWFVGLWFAGLIVVAAAAYALRAILFSA